MQPASGDAGTALGAALHVAHRLGDEVQPMTTAALGREFSDEVIEATLREARVPFERPADIAAATADVLAADGVVAWFQGRSEFGPRALGHRSLLADPRRAANLERLNDIKGREQFRPVAPMVLSERADEIFTGRIPSEYMLFTPASGPSGATVFRRSSTSTAALASRPSIGPPSRSWPACSTPSTSGRTCRWSSTRASTRRAGRWWTGPATRSSASDPRPSTPWRSDRSSCGERLTGKAPVASGLAALLARW